MKHNKWIALLLSLVLAFTAIGLGTLAETAEDSAQEQTAESGTDSQTEAAKDDAKTAHGKHKSKTAEPENAVGKQAAKDAALADANLSAEQAGKIKVRVTKMEDGTVVYRVSFTEGETRHCYKIDAVTGEILDKATEDAAAHETAKAERKERINKSAESSENGIETAGRGPRHGSGRHGSRGSGTDEAAPEVENNGGRKHGADSKSAEPTAEEGSSL
jgi:uncharacterized membrane protein YkoI